MTGTSKIVLGSLAVLAAAALVLLLQADREPAPAGRLRAEPVSPGAAEPERTVSLPVTGAGRDPETLAPSQLAPPPAAGAAPAATPERTAAEAQPRALLAGRVVDPTGRGIAGARILYREGSNLLPRRARAAAPGEAAGPETTSDAQGRFELAVPLAPPTAGEDEPLGTFFGEGGRRLLAAHDGFAVLVHPCPALREGSNDAGVLVMQPGAAVAGRIVDELGRPLADVHVVARAISDERPLLALPELLAADAASELTTARTGPDGRFRIGGLLPGRTSVRASAPDRQPASTLLAALQAGLVADAGDLVLPSGHVIAGWVRDEQGRAVAGARVSVSRMTHLVLGPGDELPRAELGHEMGLRAETDADGWFELRGLGSGPYSVHARAAGYGRATRENVAVGVRDVLLTVSRLGGLLVRLTSQEDGRPLSSADVTARPAPSFGAGFAMPETGELPVLAGEEAAAAAGLGEDEDLGGLFLVQDVPSQGAVLLARAEGHAATEVAAPGGGGELSRLDVALPPEARLSGVVVDTDGVPVAGARVRLSRAEPDAFTTVDGRIRHEVRRSVRLGGEEPEAPWQRATTDAQGRFSFRNVDAGEWEVSASASGFARSEPLTASVGRGETVDGLAVLVAAAGSVAGQVVRPDGVPVEGIDVVVSPARPAGGAAPDDLRGRLAMMLGPGSDDALAPRRATTDAEGNFRVEGLLPGRYDVRLAKSAGRRMGNAFVFVSNDAATLDAPEAGRLVDVVAREESWVQLVRPALASLAGRVVAAGRPEEGVTVKLKEATDILGFGAATARTDDSGTFRFDEVEPGRYELSAIVPGAGMEKTAAVELAAGRRATADLVFAGATLAGRVIDGDGVGVPDVLLTVAPARRSTPRAQAQIALRMVTVDSDGGSGGMHMEVGGGPVSTVRSGPDGEYEIRFLEPGEYLVESRGGGTLEQQHGPVEVLDGQELDELPLRVERGASLAGTVRSGATGQPLDGVPVRLAARGGGEERMAVTRAGRYAFSGLPAGEYSVEVLGSDFDAAPVASDAVRLEQGEDRALDLTAHG